MISIIVSAAIVWCVFAGLDALFRKKPRPMSPAEMEEMIVQDAAKRLGVTVEHFRGMLAEEMRMEEHEGFTRITNHRRRPKLRVVK